MIPKLSRENTTSNTSYLPRHLNIQGFQKFNIKSNSPRTLQACQELGIDPIVLELKQVSCCIPEKNQISNKMTQMRKSFNSDINITSTELIVQDEQNLLQNCSLKQLKEGKRQFRDKDKNNQIIMPQQNPQIDQKQSSCSNHQTSASNNSCIQFLRVRRQIDSIYNRTVSFLHQKSESPTKDHFTGDVYDLNQLEGGIEKEIDRYNKHKKQKIREAQLKLKEDAKRLQLIEKWKQKDSQILDSILKRQYAFKQKMKASSSGRKTPFQKIPQSTDPKSFKRDSESKIDKQDINVNLRGGDTSMQKTMYRTRIDDSKIKQRREMVIQRKEELNKMEDIELQKDLEKLQLKLNQSEKLSKQQAQIKVERIKEQYFREQQLIQQQREINVIQSQEHLSAMISKMINKEQEFRGQLQSQLMQDLEKKQQQKEKVNKIKQNQNDLFKDHDKKLKQLNDKFIKIEEQNKLRKQELEHKILLKQELRRLKEQDKLDNYERQKRQNDYKMMTLYMKSKFIEEKNQLKQYQNEVIQKTSMEINKQEIQERQRIYSQLQELSDNLLNYKSVSQHESRQKQDQAKYKSVKQSSYLLYRLLKKFAKLEDPNIEQHTKVILTMLQPKPVENENSNRKLSVHKK
ncbi:unnamed protein product (macronuclear) [Paramecium tetraurelia]|uniref:GRIP domain-containing protein n=1 Tax=Paramecium tetraurelia TaxID=5888 RepID=A0CZN1_PARTE|nr:uncharacterized protein GSPATT00011821001 [Paramecium tetraurelia]CAK76248.1 unnamed protein product [Paramecium tetraurelia]|eukprot:XP_001443645.1 hypothetical protein (macronuclear) [Paramecium tetraurelia strain d4-2]